MVFLGDVQKMNTATVSNLRLLSGRLHKLPFASIRVTAIARTMATIRSYGDAVEQLNSLQTNAATLEVVRASGGKSSDLAIPEMLEYLGRIGYAVSSGIDYLSEIKLSRIYARQRT